MILLWYFEICNSLKTPKNSSRFWKGIFFIHILLNRQSFFSNSLILIISLSVNQFYSYHVLVFLCFIRHVLISPPPTLRAFSEFWKVDFSRKNPLRAKRARKFWQFLKIFHYGNQFFLYGNRFSLKKFWYFEGKIVKIFACGARMTELRNLEKILTLTFFSKKNLVQPPPH